MSLSENAGNAPADFRKARRKKAELADPAKVDRLPPHSDEGEQGVLGCILLSPTDCLGECMGKLPTGSEVFYDLRHRTIYEALLDMHKRKIGIDLITVQQRLRDRQQLEDVGGLAYLASLPDAVPSAANLEYYLAIVRDKFVLRKLVESATEAVAGAYERQEDVDTLIAKYVSDAVTVGRLMGDHVNGEVQIKAVLHELIGEWEEAAKGNLPVGVQTGIHDLDHMTGGLKSEQLVIVAARPSVGKSSLALGIAEHSAVDSAIPTAFFSLEMSAKELLGRMACGRARVPSQKVRKGEVNDREIAQIIAAQRQIAKAPLYIIDKGGLTIAQFAGLARNVTQRQGIKLLIVDHIGLLGSGNKGRSRYEDVTNISIALKALAKELQIPLIGLHQLNRDNEREDRAPRLSDLRDSGSIEQDADLVALLHPEHDQSGDLQQVKLILAKHRNGPTGIVHLLFRRQLTRFESAARATDEYPA